MFDAIRLRNFRSYQDTGDVPLRPLTIIVGANNSGKSTLLHALVLLKQTLEDRSNEPLVTAGAGGDLGSFDDILRGGASSGAKELGIEVSLPQSSLEESTAVINRDEERHLKLLSRLGNRLDLRFTFDAKANRVRLVRASYKRGRSRVLGIRWDAKGYVLDPAGKFPPAAIASLENFLPGVFWDAENPDDVDEMIEWSNLQLATIAQTRAFRSAIARIGHTDPLREPVPRLTILGRVPGSGTGGESLLTRLRAEGSTNGTGAGLLEQLDFWISRRFRLLRNIRLVKVDSAGRVLALLGDERRGYPGINVANMGEGISQLLPIVVDVVTLPRGGSLLVEQPELHLHPAAQADLADLFAENVDGWHGRQYIVETHSEHLLLRLRRRVAEGGISPEFVSILYVERAGKQSRVRSLDLNKRGHFDEWPAGFFEEGYTEALKLAEAAADG